MQKQKSLSIKMKNKSSEAAGMNKKGLGIKIIVIGIFALFFSDLSDFSWIIGTVAIAIGVVLLIGEENLKKIIKETDEELNKEETKESKGS